MPSDGQAFDRAHEGVRAGARAGSSSDDSSGWAHARVGEILNDKWKLERLLGIGGMGAVYAGLHRNGARAAVKVLHHCHAKHEDVRGRFLREGYAANRVEHPSVVKVLDDDIVAGGPDDGTAYLVMELLVGESLEGWTHRGLAVTERDFLMVADVVLEVLEVAHNSGVVHRDIKPDNIFVTRAGVGRDRIKVLDFGLARLLEGSSMTVHGIALGTPPFMSPEQAAGCNDEIDGRTDLFALAASGFRLITGRRIHEGSTAVELVQKMGKLAAPRVRTVAPQVSVALARVLDRALEFRRDDRYESAAAMRADVLSALALVDTGLPLPRPPSEAPGDRSIELSASDFEAIKSIELSASHLEAIKSIELSARHLEAIKSIELSASDLEAGRSLQLGSVVDAAPVTQAMVGSDRAPVTQAMVGSDRAPVTQAMVGSDRAPVTQVMVASDRAPATQAMVGSDRAPATQAMVGSERPPATLPMASELPSSQHSGPMPAVATPPLTEPMPSAALAVTTAPDQRASPLLGTPVDALRKPAAPARRASEARALIGFAVFCVGALFAAGWLAQSTPPSSSSQPPSMNTAPSATTRLAPVRVSPEDRPTKPGKRPKH